MLDNNFYVENIRFHLYERNTLVIIGWYRDDNPQQRTLQFFFDKQEIDSVVEKKSGVEVRQKYLSNGANVSEELFITVKLPDGWTSRKRFAIYSVLPNGEQQVAYSTSAASLKKMQQSINYYMEQGKLIDGIYQLSGWAVADKDIDITVKDMSGTILDAQIERSYRKDVMAVYPEMMKEYRAGIKISVFMPRETSFKIFLKAGEYESVYSVSKVQMESGKTKANDMALNIFSKTVRYLKKNGIRATIRKIRVKMLKNKTIEYDSWLKKYDITPKELEEQKNTKFQYNPKFSIVIPLYNTQISYLKEMLDSVLSQTYTNWELCLADGSKDDPEEDSPLQEVLNRYAQKDSRIHYVVLKKNLGISENTNAAINLATGDYIVLADHDDIMAPNALFECVGVLNENMGNESSDVDIIYSDEDKIDMTGKKRFDPHFKSDFNIDLLRSMNYICHLFVVRKEILAEVGQLRSEFDGAQDYDFIFRCCEAAKEIYHIPKILYHWRCHMDSTASNPESKLYAFEAGKRALEEHYERVGLPATVEHSSFYGMYRTSYHWKEKPLVSIIIPNKDHIEDLDKCISAIEQKSTYRNYEYIIVENNSTEKETFEYYERLQQENKKVHVVYYKGDFNFSSINNFGAQYASGDYFLLLNNDTEIINDTCIEELLGYCMRDDVGVVGARLYYEDDTIQHAGVVVGFGGIAGHTFIGSSRYDIGYQGRIICAQDYSAVTAACMMTKRSIFEKVGGLTEELKVAFNDIDYCMKVRALGKLVVYNPYAELYHYESKSRGLEDTPEKVERFNREVALFAERWPEIFKTGDPYYNPNLTLDKADFSLRL